MPYKQAIFKKALDKVKQIGADLGGTELYEPIKFILGRPTTSLPRSVFVLTDGSISDRDQTVNHVKLFSHSTLVHTFGIGQWVDHQLINDMASAGKGKAYFVGEADPALQGKVIEALESSSRPAFTDLRVDWGVPSEKVLFQHPDPQ